MVGLLPPWNEAVAAMAQGRVASVVVLAGPRGFKVIVNQGACGNVPLIVPGVSGQI